MRGTCSAVVNKKECARGGDCGENSVCYWTVSGAMMVVVECDNWGSQACPSQDIQL